MNKMNIRRLGMIIIIMALFCIGVGIGLKFKDPEMNTTAFTVSGLLLNAIGLFLVYWSKKKGG